MDAVGHSEGRVASAADEIVIDAHVVEALDLSLGDIVNIGAGSSPVEFSVVGIGYHHFIFMAPEGSIFPQSQVVCSRLCLGSGMARLTNSSIGNSNTIMLDVEGLPHSILTRKNMKEMKLIW